MYWSLPSTPHQQNIEGLFDEELEEDPGVATVFAFRRESLLLAKSLRRWLPFVKPRIMRKDEFQKSTSSVQSIDAK